MIIARRTCLLLFVLALQLDGTQTAPLEYIGECSADFKCGECQGDCDTNGGCEDGLWCFERVGFTEVPGCEGAGDEDSDYCIPPVGPRLRKVGCSEGDPCAECEGACDSDDQCVGSLKCFFRDGQIAVPGCTGRGVTDLAYCYGDSSAELPTPFPTFVPPASDPTATPTDPPTPEPPTPPTDPPTPEPPTPEPTKPPTDPPTLEPTKSPTREPTPEPSPSPTRTFRPTSSPTLSPTDLPSASPTTSVPSASPSTSPTTTFMPSSYPTTSSPTFGFANTDIPERIWFKQLGSATQKGNAVTFSPDGVLIYITTADGSLRVLYASTGEERWTYTPEIGSNGWPVRCRSGVRFGKIDGIGEFAVYSIVDEGPDGGDSESESRIIVVSHPSNQVLWTSVPLAGEVAGTPFVTQSADTVGRYIFVTHNTVKGSSPEGLFSVLTAGDGTVLFTEGASSTGVANIYTYGPPGGSHFPSRGMYTGGENNTNDIVVWVTSDSDGLGRDGYLRAFQLPMGFDPAMLDERLVTSQLASVTWSAVTSPTMSEDGTRLLVTARRSRVRAWVDALFDGPESWTADLVRDSGRASLPILNEGILSVDESRFFTSSRAATFAAIDVVTGQVLWEVPSMSVFQSAPKVSLDDERVYAIQFADGRIYAWNQTSGDVLWSVSCDNYEEDCANSVDSEFDLSPDSLVLVYVDAVGRATALQVGTSRIPTPPPTDYPGAEPPVVPTNPSTTLAPASPSSPVAVTPPSSPTGTSDNKDDEPTASPVDGVSPGQGLGTSSAWRPSLIVSLVACLAVLIL